MPKPVMDVGKRWASVTCLGRESKDITGYDSEGMEYEQRVIMLMLQCDCGRRFDMPESEFTGTRKHQDCGCGAGLVAVQGMHTLPLRIPVPMMMLVKARCRDGQCTATQWIRDAIQEKLNRTHK